MRDNCAKMDRMPKYIEHNTCNSRRYLIMQYLEYSPEEYLKEKIKTMRKDTIILDLAL